jgi:hypothetical protein
MPGTFFSVPEMAEERNLVSDDQLQAPHTTYVVSKKYSGNMGLIQVPVAGPDLDGGQRRASEMIKVAAPATRMVVEWLASRLGLQPILPHPDTYDPNEVLQDWEIEILNPTFDEAGSIHKFTVRGRYTYALVRPVWILDGLPSSAPPTDVTPLAMNALQPSQFRRGII